MTELKSIENMTFEEALKELETIVKRLDSGQESLEDAINSYERASNLKIFCETKLNEAKLKIERVSRASDGTFTINSDESV